MRDRCRRILSRLRAHWRMKLWLGIALLLFVCGGYFGAQRMPLRTPVTLQPSAIDRLIPFSPDWTLPYLSLYLMLPTAWLATTREQLWRYAIGVVLLCTIAFTIFLAWPVAGPRPQQPPEHAAYRFLVGYDGPLNTFPSLHVGLAVYAACFAAHVLQDTSRWIVTLLSAWAAVIAYSTMPTKQHYFIDVVAGAALGWLAFAAAFRRRPLLLARVRRHAEVLA